MLSKTISKDLFANGNGNFIPTKIPVLKGAFAINNLNDINLPAFVAPIQQGLELVVRRGYPHLTKFPYFIQNENFKEKFSSLFKHVKKHKGLTIHAVIGSKDVSIDNLYKTLAYSENGKLPKDINIQITISVFEQAHEALLGKSCVGITKALFGENVWIYHKDVSVVDFKHVKTKIELSGVSNVELTMDDNTQGMLVVRDNGLYKQGKVPAFESDMFILSPFEYKNATIEYINDVAKILPGEILEVAESLILNIEGKNYEFNVELLPLGIKKHLSSNVNRVAGSKVLIETFMLPGDTQYSLRKLIKFML